MGQALYPARTALLEREIATLYATTSAAQARELARAMGADYAMVNNQGDRSLGLRAIGAPVMTRPGWEVLELTTN